MSCGEWVGWVVCPNPSALLHHTELPQIQIASCPKGKPPPSGVVCLIRRSSANSGRGVGPGLDKDGALTSSASEVERVEA